MTALGGCQLLGQWRIIEADIWDRNYLDLIEPATITFDKNGRGEFAFGVITADMNIEYSRRIVFFTWDGVDEMDEISGSGTAELDDDDTLEIEISFHNGDEAILKAQRI